jgi:hypothetical protein
MRKPITRCVLLLAALCVATECRGQRLQSGDDARYERLASALEAADTPPALTPLRMTEMVFAGFGEMDLGRSTRCRAALARVGAADTESDLIERGAVALIDCGWSCGVDLAALAHQPRPQQIQTALRTCPATPMFSPSEAATLSGAHAIFYLLLHTMWSQAATAAHNAPPAVQRSWQRIEAHRTLVVQAVASAAQPASTQH